MTARKQKYVTLECLMCHEWFNSARSHARTCSPRCRMQLSRAGQKRGLDSKSVTLRQLEELVKRIERK